MNANRNWGRAVRHLVAAVLLAAVSAAAFYGGYWLDEPIVVTDKDTGLQLKLMRHAELWHVVSEKSPLDIAPGERVVAAEPVGGLVYITVHRLAGQVDPKEVVAAIDGQRKPNWDRYAVFWNSPPGRAAWRMEWSFRKLNGLKTVKRVGTGLGTRIVMDYVVQDEDGGWWYVGAYIPQVLMRYYELDVKYTLLSIEFGGSE